MCYCLNAYCLHKCCKRIRERWELPSPEVKLRSVLLGWIVVSKWGRNWETVVHFGGARTVLATDPQAWGQCQAERSRSLLYPGPELCLNIGAFHSVQDSVQMCCQLRLLSQINSAKQEQDVLASFPGTRWILAVPPGELRKRKAPLSQAEFSSLLSHSSRSPSIP